MPTTQQIAAIFGCTEDQVRKQFARNARQLSQMAAKAEATGRKVGNSTAQELRAFAAKALAASKR